MTGSSTSILIRLENEAIERLWRKVLRVSNLNTSVYSICSRTWL